jgi:hypothetical protein
LRIPAMCVSCVRKRPEKPLLAENWRKLKKIVEKGKAYG